jgi:hypothetical protein
LTNATGSNQGRGCNNSGTNPFPSNFQCNPSRIDGLSVTNSSQGGGGIFVHAWAHNLEIANNRIYNNQGTLAGGISIGQGEHPDGYTQGGAVANPDPGSCQTGDFTNQQLPYCFDRFVNVHHNWISQNSSEGDELFSATPTGAGGVAFCSGADNYKFNYNWVCGNLSTGDGAGVTQAGFVWDGEIQHNAILFNQATNPTTPSNGGGLLIMSAPDTDPVCPGEPDVDCSHAYGTVGDGIGRNLRINANLIMGNAAEAGGGGGVRFQGVNGVEVSTFPNQPGRWYNVKFTNNIVANNVAGWDGGGVSLQDSIGVDMINNTIISNDATASSGTLFGAFFAPQAGSPTPCPKDAQGGNLPCYPLTSRQPAGVSAAEHSSEFLASLPASIRCPDGHYNGPIGNVAAATNGACRKASFPILYNDVILENRSFNVVTTLPGATGSTPGVMQSIVTLVPTFEQTSTGQCFNSPSTYWELGLRGDSDPTHHESGVIFDPKASVLSSITGYPGGGSGFAANTASAAPVVAAQYCNGSKRPPEAVCTDGNTGLPIPCGYSVPPGTNETNVPNPIFSLTAGATVDEGNNWVSISWGPLAMTNPKTNAQLSDFTPTGVAVNYITGGASYAVAPPTDFFGNPRPPSPGSAIDVGAIESQATIPAPTLASIAPNSGVRGTAVPVTLTGTNLTGASAITLAPAGGITVSNLTVVNNTTVTATFTITAGAALTARNVSITTPGGTSNTVTFTVTTPPAPTLTSIAPNSGFRGNRVAVTLTGTNFTGANGLNVTGGGGITVAGFTVVNNTTITATFNIGAGTLVGNRNIAVTKPGGVTSNALPFTISNPPVATVSSITPTSGHRGTSFGVTITGTNFTTAGTTLRGLGGAGLSATGVTVVNSTTITATFNITAGATVSTRNIGVTTPAGNSSNTTPFGVTP